MTSNDFINKQIDDTLNSINDIQRAEMPPFFYTKLQARLQQQNSSNFWENLLSSLSVKPAYTVAILMVFVILNVAAISTLVSDNNLNNNIPKSAQEASLQSFVQDYNLSVSTIYNNDKKSAQ